MTWSSFVRIDAPLRVSRSQVFQEERQIVGRWFCTGLGAISVGLDSAGRVEVWFEVDRAVRCGVFFTSKVEHVDDLWIQHTHCL